MTLSKILGSVDKCAASKQRDTAGLCVEHNTKPAVCPPAWAGQAAREVRSLRAELTSSVMDEEQKKTGVRAGGLVKYKRTHGNA
ncbi:hypothetical protein GN956_G9204 [Arapaima gigas]